MDGHDRRTGRTGQMNTGHDGWTGRRTDDRTNGGDGLTEGTMDGPDERTKDTTDGGVGFSVLSCLRL